VSSPDDATTTADNENDDTGAYTVTTTETDTGGDTLSGAAGTRDYTGSDTTGETVTTIETGNDYTDATTTTVFDSAATTTTTTDTYDTGTGGYDTQTVTANSNTTTTDFEDPDAATYSLTSLGSLSSTINETGSDAGSYSLTGTSSSDFSDSEAGDDDTGDYSLTTSSTDGSTYTRTGSDFDIVQSDNDSGSVTTTGNDYSGDYTATAVGADTVVTSQTDSGTDAETVSQTSTNSSTLTNTGNDYTGDFTTTGTENLATTLDDSGSNSSLGTYSLHETSSDAPAVTLTGNNIDGTQDTTQTGDETYSVSQTDSGGTGGIGYTLNETGDKSYTLTGSDDANTGDSTSTETGTDDYTLSETNITGDYSPDDDSDFSPDIGLTGTSTAYDVSDISVSGSEDYTIVTSANSQSGDFSQSFTGGGDYDRTESGTETIIGVGDSTTTTTESFSTEDSGSTDFNDTQTGDTRDGDVTLTADGTDRYSLIFGFNNPSNGAQGTSGIADYSPVGLPVLVTRMSVPAGIFSTIGDDRYDYCFAAGTLVLMADGSRKAIEMIEAGEMVLAVPDTEPEAEPGACRVLEVYHNAPAPLLAVMIAGQADVGGGEAIFTTAEHPFYVRGAGWTRAADLRAGNRLRTPGGGWANVGAVADPGRTAPVFNLRIQGGQTYFVSAGPGSPAVLVHNVSLWSRAQSAWATAKPYVKAGLTDAADFAVNAGAGLVESNVPPGVKTGIGPAKSLPGSLGRNFGHAAAVAQGAAEVAAGSGVDGIGGAGVPVTFGGSLVLEIPGTAIIIHGGAVAANAIATTVPIGSGSALGSVSAPAPAAPAAAVPAAAPVAVPVAVPVAPVAPAATGSAGVTSGSAPPTGALTPGTIGEMGEDLAADYLKNKGYTDITPIQNNSGHGIDIAARNPKGEWEFFEVKTSKGDNAPPLSDAQTNVTTFVPSRLGRAAGPASGWRNAGPALQAKAQGILDNLKATGRTPTGSVIEVTDVSGAAPKITERPWTAATPK
jgi:Holliday junction resolvase-like predicted endonuclease